MFALINTMPAVDVYVGRVISMHRSEDAAKLADSRLQRQTKTANGPQSYLPTIIRAVNCQMSKGHMVERAELE